jgi:uncharacterized membrane protein YgdD (TMEM256/DUF423 family)
VLLACGTLVGAFGAHVLKERLGVDRMAILHTAVLYQFVHALGLMLLGVLAIRHAGRALRIAINLVLAGVLLFSGSLYLLLAGAPRVLGVLTPLGGTCLIAGWCVAAVALWRRTAAAVP